MKSKTVLFTQSLSVCPEDESVILSSFYNTIAGLSIKQGDFLHQSLPSFKPCNYKPLYWDCRFPPKGFRCILLCFLAVEENELFDFRGLRLDWCRFQVWSVLCEAWIGNTVCNSC